MTKCKQMAVCRSGQRVRLKFSWAIAHVGSNPTAAIILYFFSEIVYGFDRHLDQNFSNFCNFHFISAVNHGQHYDDSWTMERSRICGNAGL